MADDHELAGELDDAARDMHRAIVSLMEEREAVDSFNQRVDACKGPELRAIPALSPGINDPYTALNCIDRLAAALALLAGRALPSRYVRDAHGSVRLVTVPYTYAGMVEAAFDQIRQTASGTPAVLFRLLEAIESIAHGDLPAPLREALRRQVEALDEASGGQFPAQRDRTEYDARLQAARDALATR
jgi:uncharacterized membrane protein